MSFVQVFLTAMMPYFEALFFISGIAGFKFGTLHGYKASVITATAVLILGKLTPFLFSGVTDILLRGCFFSAVIGIIFAYIFKVLIVQFMRDSLVR